MEDGYIGYTIVLGLPAVFWLLETLFPDKKLPQVPGWRLSVLAMNLVQLLVVIVAGPTWEAWLQEYSSSSLFQLSKITWFQQHIVFGGLLCYFISVPVFGHWHRIRHESQILWRLFHQVHHSPQTFETLMAFYKHPLEMIVDSIIMAILLYPVLGLSQASSVWLSIFASAAEWVYHSNLYFPPWCDYVFQTPRNHRIHHLRNQQGMAKNYSDIPWLYDMWVGTFEAGSNPKLVKHSEENVVVGFSSDNAAKLWDMLLFRDLLHPERPWWFFDATSYKVALSPARRSKIPFRVVAAILLTLWGCMGFLSYGLQVLAPTSSAFSAAFLTLRGLAFVSAAAPLPLVFTASNGNETFSTSYNYSLQLEITLAQNDFNELRATVQAEAQNAKLHYETITGRVDRQLYSLFSNEPYHVRNAYGALASHGPFWQHEGLKALRSWMTEFAVCHHYREQIELLARAYLNFTSSWKIYPKKFELRVFHRDGHLLDRLSVEC